MHISEAKESSNEFQLHDASASGNGSFNVEGIDRFVSPILENVSQVIFLPKFLISSVLSSCILSTLLLMSFKVGSEDLFKGLITLHLSFLFSMLDSLLNFFIGISLSTTLSSKRLFDVTTEQVWFLNGNFCFPL